MSCFFKALGHQTVRSKLQKLIQVILNEKKIAVYDPENKIDEFVDLTTLERGVFCDLYVQKLELADSSGIKLISEVNNTNADTLLILAFDAKRYHEHIKHLLKSHIKIITLDELRLPDNMLTNKIQYLNPLNWATNFVWLKEQGGTHTRLVTANYWVKYGAKDVVAYMYLLDQSGNLLAEWQESLPNKVSLLVLDSKEIKARFKLGDFMGQIFLHYVGAAGHDVVKYALDIYSDDDRTLSATHDANAWPCLYFAGLPAAAPGEKITLWLQNTHPVTIKKNTLSINIMGNNDHQLIDQEIAPYATVAIDPATYFPNSLFPIQFEVSAGNYFVRPRYEVTNTESRLSCIAHVNVERDNLAQDPNIKKITKHIGKGYILSAPILPNDEYETVILPTPMTRSLKNLPIKALIYSSDGQELAVHKFGNLPRNHQQALFVNDLVHDIGFFQAPGNYGNVQIVYDFMAGDDADGWLHAIFKYRHKKTGHFAETSFGSHIFNNITTYKGEPQSYKGPPPGLSTSLFLRLGWSNINTMCYLTYPVSDTWHARSSTEIMLLDGNGNEVDKHGIEIAANGSYLLDCHKVFGVKTIAALHNPYVIIRDHSCRLFGYHILTNGQAFSLDHMFGF